MKSEGMWWSAPTTIEAAATYLKLAAARGTTLTFKNRIREYYQSCRGYHAPTGSVVVLTREEGYHSGGHWDSPEHERCVHLGLSFRDPLAPHRPIARDKALTRQWLDAIFAGEQPFLFVEAPWTSGAKVTDTWHYRLFMAPDFDVPIIEKMPARPDWAPPHWKRFNELELA